MWAETARRRQLAEEKRGGGEGELGRTKHGQSPSKQMTIGSAIQTHASRSAETNLSHGDLTEIESALAPTRPLTRAVSSHQGAKANENQERMPTYMQLCVGSQGESAQSDAVFVCRVNGDAFRPYRRLETQFLGRRGDARDCFELCLELADGP